MKYLFILVFVFNNCQSQENKRELIYTIEKNIVESIDEDNFEIILNKEGVDILSKLDFSQYHYIVIGSYERKIPIIPSTMSLRPPNVFVYKKGNSIVISNKIQLQTKHLDKEDSNLKELKAALKKIK